MNELISIIVPVYNVEKYLHECIKSLISQTYKNTEIILVDDGSTDSSGTICDEYAEQYDNIKVYHKKNGGLSDARNFGLEKSHGALIGFVDSDDYVESNMFKFLYNLIKKYHVMLSTTRHDLIGEEDDYKLPKPTGKTELLTANEMLETIVLGLNDKKRFCSMSVWNRLYRRELIENLKFPVGKIYEDIVFSTEAIINAKYIAYSNTVLYHYRIRKGSITNPNKYDKRLITNKLIEEKKQLCILKKNKMFFVSELLKLIIRNDLIMQLDISKLERYNTVIRHKIKDIKVNYFVLLKSRFPITIKIYLIMNAFLHMR